MNLPKLSDIDVSNKKVLVRGDLDLGEEIVPDDKEKLLTLKQTLDFLVERSARVVLIGHRGRPKGEKNNDLSLRPVCEMLSGVIGRETQFVDEIFGDDAGQAVNELTGGEVLMLENLRFDPREKGNDEEFAKELAGLGEIYVNEAFSASHREHASIVGTPKFLSHCAGFHFASEVENLGKARENPKRPVVVILSGLKEDKLDYVEDFLKFADKILIAGRLPEYIEKNSKYKMSLPVGDSQDSEINDKLIVARLLPDKEDITMHAVEQFEEEIGKAGTIIVSGPIGKYEDEGHRQGTQRVYQAVANSSAFKVAGGGDTEQAIKLLELENKFDWISVGGGASLQFSAKGTLPGIEAILS